MSKNVIIVGAAGKLGSELVKLYRDENLFLFDLKEPEVIGRNNIFCKADVCDCEAVEKASEFLEIQGVRIDILIYAVGMYVPGKVTEIEEDAWKYSMDVNVNGFYRVLHSFLPCMNEGGRIIAIASQFGIVGTYESVAYCAAKAAMMNMIRCVALDYAKEKIRANCVCPGFYDSPFLLQVEKGTKMKREWMTVTNMLPRSKVNIEDVVAAVKLLGENDSITGQCIVVDGGYTAR